MKQHIISNIEQSIDRHAGAFAFGKLTTRLALTVALVSFGFAVSPTTANANNIKIDFGGVASGTQLPISGSISFDTSIYTSSNRYYDQYISTVNYDSYKYTDKLNISISSPGINYQQNHLTDFTSIDPVLTNSDVGLRWGNELGYYLFTYFRGNNLNTSTSVAFGFTQSSFWGGNQDINSIQNISVSSLTQPSGGYIWLLGNYYLYFAVTNFTITNTASPVSIIESGGSLSHPYVLVTNGNDTIGGVTAEIGGTVSQQFYEFGWDNSGPLEASVNVDGAEADSSYAFEIYSLSGALIDSVWLNQANNFTASLTDTLAAGDYKIGLISNAATDPTFKITFDTPVFGVTASAVPEPSTWTLMLAGFGALGFASYRRNRMASVAA